MNASSPTALATSPASRPTDGLSFSSLVPRRLVHRRAVAEVLLTDWCTDSPGHHRVAAQWPRQHRFYRVHDGRQDPLLLAETIRQTGILLSTTALDVPSDHHVLMDKMVWQIPPEGIRTDDDAPVQLTGCVRLTETRRRTSGVASLRFDMEFTVDGRPAGHGTALARCVSPTIYGRLRDTTTSSSTVAVDQPPPVDAAAVGMVRDDDVVLGIQGGPDEWPLRVPTQNPVLFDHPLDHVPGMLMLEGIRQAGRLQCGAPSADLAECEVDFSRFVELDEPTTVRATPCGVRGDAAALDVEVRQCGRSAAAGTVTMRAAGLDARIRPAA